MKCRDTNPGNYAATENTRRISTLNEVPGYESRQCNMACKAFNQKFALNEVPGYESRQFHSGSMSWQALNPQ